MKFMPWRDYKDVAGDINRIYQPATEDEALRKLEPSGRKMVSYKHPLINAHGVKTETISTRCLPSHT